MAQRGSRKRRKQRRRESGGAPANPAVGDSGTAGAANGRSPSTTEPGAAPAGGTTSRGYARSRAKEDAVRATLKPLAPGERPLAVTVGAIVAAIAAVANLVALAFGYDSDEGQKTVQSVLGAGILVVVAVGMWKARYWAVLGMQTLLAITLVLGSLALLTAVNLAAALLVGAIVAASGTLFWFLVKAMARIQMPQRPGADG